MKQSLLTLAFLITFFCSGIAQLGISVGYSTFNAPDWNIAETGAQKISPFANDPAVQFSADYWFRLKQKRIEFMPELSYAQHKSKDLNLAFGSTSTLKNDLIQFSFNVNIYPFDFNGDCDCPTWSKDGDVFKKGLFIRLAPGVTSYNIDHQVSLTAFDAPYNQYSGNGVVFHMRGGIGLDIGVSDFITITPIVQYTYIPNATLASELMMGVEPESNSFDSSISQLYGGIRFGFRFDELNKYGYR